MPGMGWGDTLPAASGDRRRVPRYPPWFGRSGSIFISVFRFAALLALPGAPPSGFKGWSYDGP